jgi:hypothetical protein
MSPFAETVALNTKDYNRFGGGYPSGACGKKVWISYNGKKLWAKVSMLQSARCRSAHDD